MSDLTLPKEPASGLTAMLRHARYVLRENAVTGFAFAMFVVIVILALIGPYVVPYDHLASNTASALKPPSAAHWFGTDQLGRDVFSRVIVATRLDFFIAIASVALVFLMGGLAGVAAGFFGGWTDRIVGRIADTIMAFPLFVLAMGSLQVYGIVLAGWASGSNYPLLGAVRSAAQMISYEIAQGLSLVGVFMTAGTLSAAGIVAAQQGDPLAGFIPRWYVIFQFPLFLVFLLAGIAETNRAPFDLPEAESELVAGFMVEYSSTPYLLFMLGEYVAITTMCALATIMFLGGWLPPVDVAPLNWAPGVFWFVAKLVLVFFMFAMVKAFVPRYRYDQLMRLGWKVFLPLTIGWIVVLGAWMQTPLWVWWK